jgi:hypothetical protein
MLPPSCLSLYVIMYAIQASYRITPLATKVLASLDVMFVWYSNLNSTFLNTNDNSIARLLHIS